MAFAKDAMDSLSTLPVQNAIPSYIANTTDMWLNGLQEAASSLFNDPEALYGLIDQGQLFGNDQAPESATEVLDTIKVTLFASTLRAVWMSGTTGEYRLSRRR